MSQPFPHLVAILDPGLLLAGGTHGDLVFDKSQASAPKPRLAIFKVLPGLIGVVAIPGQRLFCSWFYLVYLAIPL